jgi:hypothetical protein
LVRAHPYPGCQECGNNIADRIGDVMPYVNDERTAG